MRRCLFALLIAALALAGCTGAASGPSSSRTGSAGPASSTGARPTHPRATHRSSAPADTSPRATPTGRGDTADGGPAKRDPDTRTTPPGPTSPGPTSPGPTPGTGSGPLVVLDPGHNGANWSHPSEINKQVPAGFGRTKACNTTGTNTDAGYPEHEFTFKVAERVRAILQADGVRVIMTRTNDTGVGPCVDRRAAIESMPGVAAAVAIHADGAPSSGHGFHVCYDSRLPDGATQATMTKSRTLSTAVHDALASGSGLVPSTYIGKNGYYPRSDMAGLNLSRSPTTFLELGNMRNAHDAALQSSASGRHKIAAAVAAGILAYLGR